MFISASTECFSDLELNEAIDKLVDLEYSNIEIAIHEQGRHLKPSEIAADLDYAIDRCMHTRRLNIVAYSLCIDAPGEEYYDQFEACCKLAMATKVVTVTVPSAEIGTPFNEEVERLRRLVNVAETCGVRVSMKSQLGRLSEDPDTVTVLCDNAPGLGLTLDPTPYVCGPYAGRDIGKLMKYVYHVQLRDTSKDDFQVQIGQGEVEYGRLTSQLRKTGYDRALSAHLQPLPEIDHMTEMRKMRLLLESLLI